MNTNTHFLIYHIQFFLEWDAFEKKAVQEMKTRVLYSVTFYFSKKRAVYEKMCKNTVERSRPQIIWRMRTACWIPKATNTHSVYVTRTAFPLQQRL